MFFLFRSSLENRTRIALYEPEIQVIIQHKVKSIEFKHVWFSKNVWIRHHGQMDESFLELHPQIIIQPFLIFYSTLKYCYDHYLFIQIVSQFLHSPHLEIHHLGSIQSSCNVGIQFRILDHLFTESSVSEMCAFLGTIFSIFTKTDSKEPIMIVGNQRISASNQHVDSEIEFMSIHSQWVTDIFLSYYIVHDFATLFPIFILSFYPSFIRSIQYFKSITSATSPRYFRNILYRFHLLSFFVLITIHQLKERFTFSHIIQPESLREKRIFIKTF